MKKNFCHRGRRSSLPLRSSFPHETEANPARRSGGSGGGVGGRSRREQEQEEAAAMDPDAVKSTLSNLAFGNVIAAAARDLQKEMVAKDKAQGAPASHDEVDLDELLDDPELEKLHAERIAALKKEAEKREVLKRQGHGEYREITEGDFLGEVTGSEKVICHFYHREFYRCKIMDKHLKALAPVYVGTKFVKLDAEVCILSLLALNYFL
ncbi:hypothetical protein SEVIR_8G192400v4 [Setaria viridis]